MAIAYGSSAPATYRLGAMALKRIYIGTEIVWSVGGSVISVQGDWDPGYDGLSEATALRKAAWDSADTNRDQSLRFDAVGSGTLHVTWTGGFSTSDENAYGETDAWKNAYPPLGGGTSPIINRQVGTFGAGSYTASFSAGDFFIFHLSGGAHWDGLRVWAVADQSFTPPVISITSQPAAQTASGGAATFSVSATTTYGTLSYQWYRQAKGVGSFSAVSGATSSTLSLSGLSSTSNDGDVYRCDVSCTGAVTATSSEARLTVPSSGGSSGDAFYSPNATWTSVGFYGTGTAADPFVKGSIASGAGDGMSIRVSSSGYVRFRADSLSAPYYYLVTRNGTSVFGLDRGAGGPPYWGTRPVPYWSSDFLPVPGGSWYLPVSAGDRIVFSANTSLGAPLASFTNLAIWYAPTATDLYS